MLGSLNGAETSGRKCLRVKLLVWRLFDSQLLLIIDLLLRELTFVWDN
jgi:hypothetical protein